VTASSDLSVFALVLLAEIKFVMGVLFMFFFQTASTTIHGFTFCVRVLN